MAKLEAFTYELRFLQAAAPELKDYLLSKETYWNLGLAAPAGYPPYPRFSLGWLLLYRRHLDPISDDPQVRQILQVIHQTEEQWRSNWQRKAAVEFGGRLRLWADFMNDVRRDSNGQRDRYAFEVQRRAMLDLLQEAADEIQPEQLKLLRVLDSALRKSFKPGGFIESQAYEAQFLKERYWYLYGSL